MDRFHNMSVFVEVVEQGGFTAAMDKTGLSRAQVSKLVMQLEEHLGTRLLNRTTRRISLTETGRIYYERCKALLVEVDEIDSMASEQTTTPRGKITIGAPSSFGTLHFKNVITEYMKQYPQVQISLHLTDRFVDVVDEGFDVVVRIAELADSSLIARKLSTCKLVVCASPDYLKEHGEPKVPQDLALHQCLLYSNAPKPDTWTLYGPAGMETVRVSGPLTADNGDILKAAALADQGVVFMPTFIVGEDIHSGRLQQILTNYCPPDLAIHAVFPSRRYLSAKVRTFVDFAATYFGDIPEWDRH